MNIKVEFKLPKYAMQLEQNNFQNRNCSVKWWMNWKTVSCKMCTMFMMIISVRVC